MKKADVVVIGGSAAGIPAAITARRHYPEKTVLLVRKEKQVSIPCGIPYIFGTVGTPDKNLIPDAVLDKNKIDLLVDEVVAIDREGKTITTKTDEVIGYDKLVFATGSVPILPPIPGFDKENIFTIYKEVPYLADMQEKLKSVSNLVIIGGGFIGVEFADECNKLKDINVTIVELLPRCLMLAYDEEFCEVAEKLLVENGITVISGQKVESITGGEKVEGVQLADGTTLKAEAVIMSIGAKANVTLAGKSELRIGPMGSIAVDSTMKTSDENIYACGDCTEKVSFFGGKPSTLKLASIATTEARVAGANLYEIRRENIGTIGVFSTAIGDTAFAAAGLTEQNAKRQGYKVVSGVMEAPNRHPGGMPGMMPLKVKLTFEKNSGILLGGQIMGGKSAGELINTISACIQHKMTANDIAQFQIGTHPALTASPIAYQLVNAAEIALIAMRTERV